MTSISSFDRDLKRGKYHESVILSKVRDRYPSAYIVDGYCKEWDIYIPELSIGVEVKSDEKSKYTNNIVVEVEFNGKPSALSTTKSAYWVIYDGYVYNWFEVSEIKRCIKENRLRLAEFVGNGDTKPKKAYLIKKNLLYKYRCQQ